MGLKITYAKFKNGEPFYPALVGIADQTWGGKQDAALMALVACVQEGVRVFSKLRDKYIKDYGEPSEDGNFSLKGISKASLKEYDALIEEAYGIEIDLPIDEPLKLIKRKKTNITPLQAAALVGVVEIVWPEDDGSDLDKVEKK